MHNLNFFLEWTVDHNAIAKIQQPICMMQTSHPQKQSQRQGTDDEAGQKLQRHPTENAR